MRLALRGLRHVSMAYGIALLVFDISLRVTGTVLALLVGLALLIRATRDVDVNDDDVSTTALVVPRFDRGGRQYTDPPLQFLAKISSEEEDCGTPQFSEDVFTWVDWPCSLFFKDAAPSPIACLALDVISSKLGPFGEKEGDSGAGGGGIHAMYLGTVALGGSAGEHDDHLLSARTDSEEEETETETALEEGETILFTRPATVAIADGETAFTQMSSESEEADVDALPSENEETATVKPAEAYFPSLADLVGCYSDDDESDDERVAGGGVWPEASTGGGGGGAAPSAERRRQRGLMRLHRDLAPPATRWLLTDDPSIQFTFGPRGDAHDCLLQWICTSLREAGIALATPPPLGESVGTWREAERAKAGAKAGAKEADAATIVSQTHEGIIYCDSCAERSSEGLSAIVGERYTLGEAPPYVDYCLPCFTGLSMTERVGFVRVDPERLEAAVEDVSESDDDDDRDDDDWAAAVRFILPRFLDLDLNERRYKIAGTDFEETAGEVKKSGDMMECPSWAVLCLASTGECVALGHIDYQD